MLTILKKFIICDTASSAVEISFMLAIIFPLLYYGVSAYGSYYIYVGRAIETNKNLADYVNSWSDDGWELNVNASTYNTLADKSVNLPNVMAQYFNMFEFNMGNDTNYLLTRRYDTKIYVGYVDNKILNFCDTVTYSAANPPVSYYPQSASGVLPTTAPVLDSMTLSAPGPVWIVVSAYRIYGISRTVTSVRRPPNGKILISRNSIARYCKVGFNGYN